MVIISFYGSHKHTKLPSCIPKHKAVNFSNEKKFQIEIPLYIIKSLLLTSSHELLCSVQ